MNLERQNFNSKSEIGIIILAAGASTRMGQPKQLLEFKGETLIQKVIKTVLATDCRPIVVVLGAFAEEILLEIGELELGNRGIGGWGNREWGNGGMEKSSIFIVQNSAWQQGMSTSVKIGLETLFAANPNLEAALFLLTDQPLVTTAYLLQLINYYKDLSTPNSKSQTSNPKLQTSIIASFYNNRPGIPVLFHKKWFPALKQLTGDQGARKLLELHQEEVHAIPFPEGAFDLDTPENYEFLIQHFG